MIVQAAIESKKPVLYPPMVIPMNTTVTATRPSTRRGIKRGNASRLPALPIEDTNFVQIGKNSYTISSHLKHIANRTNSLLEVFRMDPSQRDKIAQAMICGTIIAEEPGGTVFRRCNYCRCNELCRACKVLRHVSRAERMVERLQAQNTCRGFSFVFSPEQSSSRAEGIEQLQALEKVREKASRIVAYWNQKNSKQRVHEYAVGLHAKFIDHLKQWWPHLHFFVIADARADEDRFENHLRTACFHHADTAVNFRFKTNSSTRFRLDEDSTIRSAKSGRVITEADLMKQLTYTMDTGEKEDNVDDAYQRAHFFDEAGVKKTFTHSRKTPGDGVPSTVTSQAHEFPPDKLSKNRVFRLDFQHEFAERIDADKYEATTSDQLRRAMSLLRNVEHLQGRKEVKP